MAYCVMSLLLCGGSVWPVTTVTDETRRDRQLGRRERVLGPVACEAVAAVLLALRVGGRADRFVRLQAAAEAAADGRRRRDEPGQHDEVAVSERRVEVAAHHARVEDEQCPD